ncbi:MAG: electron transfer flavoprotein subunit beta/FixA family protein [Proteobacteria bacterium]|nr:electron transfer flavoprotein subunit beta/FixA family protein [Pseudomonadota bacterium]
MKIVVLLKQTPDTESKIVISADGARIETAGLKSIINPYDEYAIEEALKLKEKAGAGEVVIASFGTDAAKELIVKGLAMGADRGLLISNEGLEAADSLAIAKVLAAAVKAESADLVLAGKQAIDDDNMHVAVMVAELLKWPHVNVVDKLTLSGKTATVEREVEGGQVEVYEVQLPAVLGANKALNTPRYASLPGIMKAKKKPFDVKKPGDFGLDAGALKSGIKAVIKGFTPPPEKPAGKVFKGEDVSVMVEKVVKLLREEAKVI